MTDDFFTDLEALGYRRVQARRGDEHLALAVNRYLTYHVHTEPDAALFTWELAVGEFMNDHGLQIGSNEALNLFLFPLRDARGPATADFVVSEMERAEHVLGSLDFLRPRSG